MIEFSQAFNVAALHQARRQRQDEINQLKVKAGACQVKRRVAGDVVSHLVLTDKGQYQDMQAWYAERARDSRTQPYKTAQHNRPERPPKPTTPAKATSGRWIWVAD